MYNCSKILSVQLRSNSNELTFVFSSSIVPATIPIFGPGTGSPSRKYIVLKYSDKKKLLKHYRKFKETCSK